MTGSTVRPLSPRQSERRQRILASAISLVGALGYDAVTMRMIAQESGASEKTLYNIFGSKDRLVALAARSRSSEVFALAAKREPRTGLPRLCEFARTAAEVTLETPVLSRALATLLVDHSELVGLHEVYESEVGEAFRAMIAEGLLAVDTPLGPLVRITRLAVVSAVLLWAKHEVTDAELEPYILRRCAETLMPFASPGGLPILREIALKAAISMN